MTVTENMLEWIDRLRAGVANQNHAAEQKCLTAMSATDWLPIDEAPTKPDAITTATPRILVWVPPYGPFTANYEHGSERWRVHGLLNKEAQPTHFRHLSGRPA